MITAPHLSGENTACLSKLPYKPSGALGDAALDRQGAVECTDGGRFFRELAVVGILRAILVNVALEYFKGAPFLCSISEK